MCVLALEYIIVTVQQKLILHAHLWKIPNHMKVCLVGIRRVPNSAE